MELQLVLSEFAIERLLLLGVRDDRGRRSL
jgi:hypothetical protein